MSEERRIGERYDAVDLPQGPAIYSSSGLYDAMFALGDFYVRDESFRVLDAMCGAGLVGKEISARAKLRGIPHTLHYIDVAGKKLRELAQQGDRVVLADVCHLPYRRGYFDRVYSRFGIKNYPREEQVAILNGFRDAMKSDGIFVLCDMESPEEAYEFMQLERREKHKYTRLEGSEPHMPTRQIWFQLLRQSDLEPQRVSETKSYVTTVDWVNSNQMSGADLEQMNRFLLAAPEEVRRALNIREESGLVKIDYPVVVISATAA